MKKPVLAAFAALILMPLIGSAQVGVEVVAKIPFKFEVLGKTLPAGNYEFKLTGTELNTVMITNTKTDPSIMAPILAPNGLQPPANAKVVFEKVGKISYLSEVVIPGLDGYLISAPAAEHRRTTVRGMP